MHWRLALLLLLVHHASGRASIRVVRSRLGCGVARSLQWTRTACFGYARVLDETLGTTGLAWAEVNLTVAVLPADAEGEPQPPACGDALRVRFSSRTSLFAPATSVEVECGVHTLRFVVPPDDSAFRADVWVVHVDGEGLADPPVPLLYPKNLADTPHGDGEGPRLFNACGGMGARPAARRTRVRDGSQRATSAAASMHVRRRAGLLEAQSSDAARRPWAGLRAALLASLRLQMEPHQRRAAGAVPA